MKLVYIMVFCAMAMVGCMSPDVGVGAPVENVAVIVTPGKELKMAVLQAAARRRWTAREVAPDRIRCQIIQRQHEVSVDVILLPDGKFSIVGVSSNIPVAKYNQWVNNLQREIVLAASRL